MRKPVTESDIPIIKSGEDFLKGALKAYVDGQPALIAVVERDWGSDKIVIDFEKENTEWPEGFGTKYFIIKDDEPGVLHWGHEGRSMKVEA